jgi:hypothetical protein
MSETSSAAAFASEDDQESEAGAVREPHEGDRLHFRCGLTGLVLVDQAGEQVCLPAGRLVTFTSLPAEITETHGLSLGRSFVAKCCVRDVVRTQANGKPGAPTPEVCFFLLATSTVITRDEFARVEYGGLYNSTMLVGVAFQEGVTV